MSYSSVYQGLQSCLEPRIVETRVLNLTLAPPSSSSSHSPSVNSVTNVNDENLRGWSFLQSLSNISHFCETEEVYVHPTVKSKSSMLNAKSLELCTESLGCETGSNASESSDEMSVFSFESNQSFRVNRNTESKRVNRVNGFPPPLTSMGGLQVRSHREGGRLILEAVTSSSPQPYFHAERGNGRLTLRLFESVYDVDDDDDDDEEDEILNQEEEEGFEENGCNGEEEDKVEMSKFVRPRRCKESGNRDIFGDGYIEHSALSLCL